MAEPAPNFAIIPVPYGTPSPNSAIAHGPLSQIMEHVLGSRARADAEALVKRAADAAEQEHEREQQEQQAISEGVRALRDGILKISHRVDVLVQSRDARRKLDAVSEATKEMLELPKEKPPEILSDYEAEPGGELHVHPAKDPAQHNPEADDQGDLPRELERGAPSQTGNYPTLEDPPPPQTAQPVAISLNKEC
jgi:hypothetical protein